MNFGRKSLHVTTQPTLHCDSGPTGLRITSIIFTHSMLRASISILGPQIKVLPRIHVRPACTVIFTLSHNAKFLCRYYYQVIQHYLLAFLRTTEPNYIHMETSGGNVPFSTQTTAPAKASPGSSALNNMSLTSTHGDTLGIGDLALDIPPENNHKKKKRALRHHKKRLVAEATWPRSDAEPVKQLAARTRAGKVGTIGSPSALQQAADAQRPVRQGRASELYGTDASVMRAASNSSGANAGIARRVSVNEAQTTSVKGSGDPTHGIASSSNGAASVRLPPLKYDGNRGFVPLIATTSVPLFRRVPPWRVNKWHRYAVPSYQALPVVPIGQRARPVTRGIPTTAISLDRLSSPKRGLPSISQPARGLTTKVPQGRKAHFDFRPSDETTGKLQDGAGPHSPLDCRSIERTTSPLKQKTPLPTPTPTSEYLSTASLPCKPLLVPQRLLLVLDLNGTLLFRHRAASSYRPRASLKPFLNYCLTHHSVLIWSSATPTNVTGVCAQLFTPKQRRQLLGEWARDTLDLTSEEYCSKVQVYKRLDRIWEGRALQDSHPDFASKGTRWNQANTLLVDDSPTKAQAQPYNLVEIPEFTRNAALEKGKDFLGQVVAYLEEARMWGDVSTFAKRKRFVVDGAWAWNWEKGMKIEDRDEDSGDDGGVRLWG